LLELVKRLKGESIAINTPAAPEILAHYYSGGILGARNVMVSNTIL
jgi:hypothetical protein